MLFGQGITMKRNTNDFSENGRDDETTRQRSLSASFADPQQANQEWLLANQQRLLMQAQSEALATAVAAAGGRSYLGLEEPSSRVGVGVAQPPATSQLAAAMIRQQHAEDALRQAENVVRQSQAVAVAEYYLQQQAAAANTLQQGSNNGSLLPQGATNQSSLPQGFGDQVNIFNNQATSSIPRNAAGMFDSIYRIPIEASFSEAFPNHNNEVANPAASAFGSGVDFNTTGPVYSSLLLSSQPAPLNSHLAPVQPTGMAMPPKKQQDQSSSSPKPKKPKTNPQSKSSAPKVSIAGPKRNPVSLQFLVKNGEACYDPGPVRELALPSDRGNLSEYQCLLRKQIVLFSVSINDIQCSAQGRNKPIVIGQVGVLCRHCARIPPGQRPCGAAYFPGKLSGLYQAAQNMAINHLSKSCRSIDDETKETLIKLKAQKSTVLGGGKNFWANGAKFLGVVEVEEGHLRFQDG